ncbi:MAG: hypothetical protein SPF36_07815 [Lachnospiraceae bacterium]|nr:hypothetical protein [Lachnospiraceae bacterium]
MIDISTALQNILKAVYGRDVRESIHDAIYQIDANANEAIDLAQIKFGTAVNSPTDPIAGFTENSVYLNVNTGIMWRLEGGSWVKKGTFKSIDSISLSGTSGLIDTYTITFTDGSTSNYSVKNGADGKSITGITKTSTSGNVDHYDVNLSDGTTTSGFDVTNGTNGTDGKSIANISLASTSGNVKNYDVFLDDGTKTPTGFSVEDGASSYLHIRYSSSFDGTGMVTTPTDSTVYIGILVSTSSVAPTNPSLYSWVRFIGKSGTGSGDMLATDYATKYPNTVDKAAALYDGTDEILANQLMKKSVYDADGDGVVDNAEHATNADSVGNADTPLLEKLSDNSGKLNYNGNALMLEMAQLANQAKLGEFVVNKIGNNVKELALHSNITTKLSKLNSDGTLDFSNVGSKPTTLSGYGITDAYTKSNTYSKTEVDNKLDSWFSQTKQATATGEQSIIFTELDTTKAYELWFETTNGSQVSVKSSSLSGTTMTYVINIPTDCPVPVNFKLRVIK